jgi:hypothetical protein
MDPLSITVSALTLLSFLGSAVVKVKNMRDANKEVKSAVEDLSDFRVLVQQANNLVVEHAADMPESQIAMLSNLLKTSREKVEELDSIIQVLIQSASTTFKASKIAGLRHKSKVTALRRGFGNMKLSLSTMLNSMTM